VIHVLATLCDLSVMDRGKVSGRTEHRLRGAAGQPVDVDQIIYSLIHVVQQYSYLKIYHNFINIFFGLH
jgi:hypothetical protein